MSAKRARRRDPPAPRRAPARSRPTSARRGRCRRGPAGRRPCSAAVRIVRVGRVAERQQVLAVAVVRVAEQLAGRGRARRPSPGRCRSRAPRPPASCSPAAMPRSNMTDSGLSAAARIRASRARSRPPRRRGGRPTVRPSRARARCSRSRQTMKSQRWRFFELAGAPAGVEDPDEVVGLERPIGELRGPTRFVATACQTDIVGRRRRSSASSVADRRPVVVAGVGRRRRRSSPRGSPPARRGPGRSGRATGSRPARCSIGSAARTASGMRRASTAAARAAASSGASGPPRARRRNAATVRRYAGNSYSQECWPPSITSVSTGVPGRRPARRPASRSRWATGTTVSSVAVDEQDRARDPARGPRGAEISATRWPRGRR